MTWGLPTSVEINGADYEVRTDFREILDICAACSDPELSGEEKTAVVLSIFFKDVDSLPPEYWREGVEMCFWFINGGVSNESSKSPRLMDWEQDFPYICGPVNRVLGEEVRAVEYMHWWTFLAAYMEIGDCTFAQVVRIRDHLARGKPLDKQDRIWYRQNRHLVDFQKKYTSAEQDLLKEWGGG